MATKRQTFRLYPNKAQERVLFEARRNHAYLYNACVAHRRYEWRANQKKVTYFEQQNCLPAFKKEWVDFAYLHSQAMQAIEQKGGLMLALPTKQIKPSQRCPNCGKVHKHWAELSNRYHICDACCFEVPRDRGYV